MNENENRAARSPIGTGMISILMVLIVLLLTAFAALSYTTARAEARLTDKTLTAVTDYYAADAQAERLLFRIETMASETANFAELAEQLAGTDGVSLSLEGSVCTADCIIPVDDARQIRMVLRITGKDGAGVEVLSRKIESTAVWEDENINLWDGT
jgi:Tfp pilus assembly protein PilX